MTEQTVTAPGPIFAAGIQLATGVHRTDDFAVAQVLAYHVPSTFVGQTDDHVRGGMRAMAASLGLGPCDTSPPYIGHRLRMRRGTPFLDYGRDDYLLALPAGEEWRTVVEWGGPVRILVLFEPLSAGASRDTYDAHVRWCFEHDAMRWGTTYHV
ncbi:hypothetical protein [Streptomyces coelicoflavus]